MASCMGRNKTATEGLAVQTGAGKTYTLGNTAQQSVGVMPRACIHIFQTIAADPGHSYSVFMSVLQLYTEKLQVGISLCSCAEAACRLGILMHANVCSGCRP